MKNDSHSAANDANVYYLPDRRSRAQKIGGALKRGAWEGIKAAWFILRLAIYFPMLWLRVPVRLVLGFGWVINLIAFLLLLMMRPDAHKQLWMLGGGSFFLFMCVLFYDFLLEVIEPQGEK